ncbi:DUF6538 domain-containing protein [Gemmobacter sp. 24YEA27]|uniref:DUF6538 domain-containing protein n=1 Tax=Gemmobacter sp. 24YEA27 TaxID=3040672 RepID=UPI0024B3B7A7|nr:DUF6538 domain-containing protein [Gemmobacter sp. 24YEA27]
MAGRSKYLYFKRKRYSARIAVPKPLQGIMGKTELTKALGADRREAEKRLPGVVASMLRDLELAERKLKGENLHGADDLLRLANFWTNAG